MEIVWLYGAKPPLDVPTLEPPTTSRSPLGSAVERVTSNDKVVSSTLAVGISFCSGGDAIRLSFCRSLQVLLPIARPRVPFSFRGHRPLSAATVGTLLALTLAFTPASHSTTFPGLSSFISLGETAFCIPFEDCWSGNPLSLSKKVLSSNLEV